LRGLPPSFRHWQKRCFENAIPPVIAVAGSRGKSTVVRLLQAIFDHAGVQSAIWTDMGVEINGRRQSREIAGWNRALARLMERSLDVAVQELDWNLVAAVGLPDSTYPIEVITNLCNNSPQCMATRQGETATRALPRVARAAHPTGFLCINGEDYALEQGASASAAVPVVVAKSESAPLLRHQRESGGTHLWIDAEGNIVGGLDGESVNIINVHDIPICLEGGASFQQTNVLLACAAALATGIGSGIIREALLGYESDVSRLPGSFTSSSVGSIQTYVDRVMPSWFLRPVLRAVNPQSTRRQITVIGGLGTLPLDDVFEIGRLIGRAHGAVIHHGDVDRRRYEAFKRGIARNHYPPVLLHLPTERRAINRALRAMRADDVVLFLCDGDPGPAIRAISRIEA
jgi:UDP-N-acetylmuramyl tripeptide synthase